MNGPAFPIEEWKKLPRLKQHLITARVSLYYLRGLLRRQKNIKLVGLYISGLLVCLIQIYIVYKFPNAFIEILGGEYFLKN
jgi:hypothetical protein